MSTYHNDERVSMTTFGYEFEVQRNGLAVLARLHDAGAVANDYLCPYHGCGSDCCDHGNEDYLFSAQEDCTVSAEFPSKVLTWGTERAERAFRVMEFAAARAGADLSGDSGMHVHVAKPGGGVRYGDPDPERIRATWRVARIFARYQDDLLDIAAGHRQSVRGYNSPNTASSTFWNTDVDDPDVRPIGWREFDGSYLELDRHTHTYEFRLWNASKAAWRQRLCCGISVAIVEAAADEVDVTRNDRRSLLTVLAPYLDDENVAALIRQHHKFGVAA